MPSNVIPMEPAYPLYQSFKNRINLLPDICLKLSKHELDDLQWKFSTAKTWALQFPFNNLSIVISVQWSEHCNFRRTISVRPELVEGLSELVCNRLASTLLQAQGIRRMPVQAYGKCRSRHTENAGLAWTERTLRQAQGIRWVSVQAYWEFRFRHTESVGSVILRVSVQAYGEFRPMVITWVLQFPFVLSLSKGSAWTESAGSRGAWLNQSETEWGENLLTTKDPDPNTKSQLFSLYST